MNRRLRFHVQILPGLIVSLIIAVGASYIGHLIPVVGSPISAIVLGLLFSFVLRNHAALQPGLSFTSKRILQLAIILLGANLNLTEIWQTGSQSFWVMIGSLLIALTGGTLIGRFLQLPRNLIRLITVGTSICGASAISAVAPIVAASDEEIAYAVSTIFLFNVIAVFLFPLIGHVFHFSSAKFGLWAGTAINDTSSVVAAGYSFSHAAGQYATVVKLTRSLAIIPVSLGLAIQTVISRRATSEEHQVGPKTRISFPLFILGFVVMSLLDTLGLFGHSGGAHLSQAGQFCIAIALAAIGLGIDIQSLKKTGYRPLLMGLTTWSLVAASSLILQAIQ